MPPCSRPPDLTTAIWTLLLDDLTTGRLPFVRTAFLHHAPPLDELVPDGAVVTRRVDRDMGADWVIEGDGYRGRLERLIGDGVVVRVFATSVDTAQAVVDELRSRCPEPPVDDAVHVSVWHGKSTRSRRRVVAPAWADVACNYPRRVRDALAELVALRPCGGGGRVILLHGEPGTGKTTAIRSLLGEWRSWADAHVVTDSDQLLHDPGYLGEVTSTHDGTGWQVIVIEDAGSLIEQTVFGGDLSRLLNVTDGIVGAGSRTLFLLTTNEAIGAPHRALTRPGRCLANIEFERFSRREAVEWLGCGDGVPSDGLSLAELYERRATATVISNVAPPAVHGVYL